MVTAAVTMLAGLVLNNQLYHCRITPPAVAIFIL